MSFTFGWYRNLHPLESGGGDTWYEMKICCRLPIRDSLHPILGIFDVTDIIRDYLPCGSLVRIDIFRDREVTLGEIYRILLSVACCEECTGMVLEMLKMGDEEGKDEKVPVNPPSHPWQQYQEFMRHTFPIRSSTSHIHDSVSSALGKEGGIDDKSSTSLPIASTSSHFSLDRLHSGMYRGLLYTYLHFNNLKYAEEIKKVPKVNNGIGHNHSILDIIFYGGNDGLVGKHVEFETTLSVLMDHGAHYSDEYLERVINCGTMIYVTGSNNSILRVMGEGIPWSCKFLAIVLFSSPSQIDFVVERYNVGGFVDILQSGREFVGVQLVDLSRNDTMEHMYECGYYLLHIFGFLLEDTEDRVFLEKISQLFWLYMIALVRKFYKVTRTHTNAITVHVGQKDVFLSSSIVDCEGKDGKFTVNYRCGNKEISILYAIYFLTGRFAKGKWKNDVVEHMEGSLPCGEDILSLLRGDSCKCRCECEMIKDILLPKRFAKMTRLAEDILSRESGGRREM